MEHSQGVLQNSDALQVEQKNIMRFLIMHGFTQGSVLAIRNISLLIAKNVEGLLTHLTDEYALLSTQGERPETVRAKLVYCIKQNHEALKDDFKLSFRYDLGNFYGIKSFIDQISLIYSLFATAE